MRILVTGGTGLVGSAFKNVQTDHEIILRGSSQYDLRREQDVDDMIHRVQPDAIIHLAAKVGGVKGNSDYVADFFYDNMIMNLNVLNWARIYNVPRVLSLLSTCIYPDQPTYPLTENQIHGGEPHESNFGYAYAKRMLEVHSRAIRKQYGLKYITAVPNNIYGPHDNFDLENGHVVPAIIRKFKENDCPTLWGDGTPLREFTYSEDIARALLLLIEYYDSPMPINIGNPDEVSILELAEKVASHFSNVKSINWDINKPKGQYKKPSSNSRFLSLFPEFKYTNIDQGLETTVEWFKKEYPNVRGVKL